MSEQNFWEEMSSNLGHRGHFSRVESHSTSAGIPDIDFCMSDVESHIELKYGDEKKAPSIRPSQVKWFARRVKAGGHPIIIAKIVLKDGPRYCFYSGSKARELYDAKTSQDWLDLANLVYCSPAWDTFYYKILEMCRVKSVIL